MSNSSLICYTQISPNRSSPRNDKITDIAIHCMAGHLSLRSCGNLFANPNTQASSNYGINDDGEIGMFVEECDRSWCTSSRLVDNRAVTIEVASDASGDCAVTDAALVSVIKLCADICKRNGIAKLIWSNSKNDRVNKVNGCNMQVHRDYANKSCPGDYLYSRMGYIANEVNKILDAGKEPNLVVDGYDYSIVYDYDYYINKYADIKNFYGENDKYGVFTHFLNYGMREGRQAKETFNVKVYKENYADLRKEYGDDTKKYFQHYIKYGKKEKRVATYHIIPVMKYNGIDYSAVYDGAYYLNKYNDLQKAYGNNYDELIKHFVNYGMKEHRQAKATFNVDIYKANYKDLQEAFGDDIPKYYEHYIKYGQREKRVADRRIEPVTVEYYTYKSGDSIADILKKKNITVDEFLKLNNITFTDGQKLRVK